jgi:hypothetical protein
MLFDLVSTKCLTGALAYIMTEAATYSLTSDLCFDICSDMLFGNSDVICK